MQTPATPPDEALRLEALRTHELLDTPAEPGFDALVKLAAKLLDVPIALVSIVDADRQWFKAKIGVDAAETPRDLSFCGHVVADGRPLVVPDARSDVRFADNPLVTGDPRVRFYAGMPLRTADGYTLGTLCAIDRRPRVLDEDQLELLRLLAEQASDQLAARRQRIELVAKHEALLQAGAQLREREAQLRALFDGMSEGVVLQQRGGVIVQCNRAAEQILGLDLAQMRGQTSLDPRWKATHPDGTPFPGEDHPVMQTLRTGLRAADVPMRIERADGTTVTISINVEPLAAGGDGLPESAVCTFRDTTSEHEARAELAQKHAFLHALLANLPRTTVTVFDPSLRITRAFGVAQDAANLGGQPEDRIGRSLLAVATDENRARIEAGAQSCLAGGLQRFEVSRNGRRFEMSLAPLDAAGEARQGLLVAHDVTEREALREQLTRQERLATIGTLAAGLGHEINNPLAYITSNLELSLEFLKALPAAAFPRLADILEMLGDANAGAGKITDIVRAFRELTRGEGTWVAVDLIKVLAAASSAAMDRRGGCARIERSLRPVPKVLADEALLARVFVNLIDNAMQSFATSDPERNQVVVRTALLADGRVEVSVEDNGQGIAPDVLPRIFDPFFTTRAVNEGAGLGLSSCHATVTALGGEILCETRQGFGTTFRVRLLAQDGASNDATACEPPGAAGMGRLRTMP